MKKLKIKKIKIILSKKKINSLNNNLKNQITMKIVKIKKNYKEKNVKL